MLKIETIGFCWKSIVDFNGIFDRLRDETKERFIRSPIGKTDASHVSLSRWFKHSAASHCLGSKCIRAIFKGGFNKALTSLAWE